MELLIMTTNRALNSTNFIRIINRGFVFLQANVFKFEDLLGERNLTQNAQFQLNIWKIIPVKAKNTGTWDVNTTVTYIV